MLETHRPTKMNANTAEMNARPTCVETYIHRCMHRIPKGVHGCIVQNL